MIQDISLLFRRIRAVVQRLITRKITWPYLKDYNPFVNWEEMSMQYTTVLTHSQAEISGSIEYDLIKDSTTGYVYQKKHAYPFPIELCFRITQCYVLILVMVGHLVGLSGMVIIESLGLLYCTAWLCTAAIRTDMRDVAWLSRQWMMRVLSIAVKPLQWCGLISGYLLKIIFPMCGIKLITAFECAAYCGPLLAKSFSLFPVMDNDSGQPINVDKTSIPADKMRAYFENYNGPLNGGRGTWYAERCVEGFDSSESGQWKALPQFRLPAGLLLDESKH